MADDDENKQIMGLADGGTQNPRQADNEEQNVVIDPNRGKVIITPISKEMQKAYLDYAMSVIVARALPDVRDGLKPVQRRIVFAANDMHLDADARYSKSAKLVGEVIGKYHPHADTSIYEALVHIAQDFKLRYPLIDGQGNFGNVDGDPAAAMRYTECRLERIADHLLKDIDKDTVDFVDNYSVEYKEPLVLPSVIPNLMMNGAIGIAVGMATNIPPHNLGELIDGIVLSLDKGKANTTGTETKVIKAYDLIETTVDINPWDITNSLSLEELAEVIKGPDFPTGCTIYDRSETLSYFATGRGKIIQQGKAKIEELKNGRYAIIISEIPFQVNKSSLVEKIAELVTNKKIKEISEIRDESSKKDLKIVVELKKEGRPQKILNSLYKYTPLQSAFNVNMLALVNGEPETLGLKQYIEEFIKHRRNVVTRRTIYDLKKAREREHILEGLKIALDFIDEVIDLIRKSQDSDEAKDKLVKRFNLTEIQAQAILDMQLRRLAALEREKIENELAEIQKNINRFILILKSPEEMIKIIKSELLEIKDKFADQRKTKVVKGRVGEFEEEDLISNESTLISITESGYIKRIKPSTYKIQSRGGKGVMGAKIKSEDEVSMLRHAETHDRILFLSDKGKIYEKRVWDIPEGSRTSKGTAVVNLLEMESSERLAEVITLDKEAEKKKDKMFLLTATKLGQIKKTEISQFENIRRTGIVAISLKPSDFVISTKLTDGSNDVILVSSKGKSIRFKEKDVRPMGRSASGVRGIKIKGDDYVVSMEVISNKDKDSGKLFTLTSHGYGKMSSLLDFSIQNRGGSGIIAHKTTPKTGSVVCVKIIDIESKSNDILITSEQGQIIRIPVTSVPTLTNRSTQGVILMRLNSGDMVSAATIFEKEE